tara:strand:+ start:63119 stop:63298 length:180 start_codon:yes stop_codon:yes gene_type:complete
VEVVMQVSVDKNDLITLIKMAQSTDDMWDEQMDRALSALCKKYRPASTPITFDNNSASA